MNDFKSKYGPWALVAGASEGLGAAFAEALAKRGLNLVLIARRPEKLQQLANFFMGRLLPRKSAISIMDNNTTDLS